jgi:protein O-GlcNAc transferase
LARAARIHPNDASIQYNLAKALADSGNDKDALTHHKKAVTLAPNNPEAWLNYGKTAFNLGRYQDALVWYGNALGLKPDYAEAALNKGATLKELKQYEEAIAFAEQALAINPNLAEALANKGVALKELKRFDEAIAHYDKALSLKPDYHEAWTNKGATLHELKRFDEAIAHYDKALSLKHDYVEAWTNKGATLHELKRFDEAIAHYDKALTLKPGDHEAWTNKGATLHQLKRFDEAIAHYEKALSLKPDNHEAWANKGATLYELKRFDEAIAHCEKVLSLKPDDHEAWTNKGATLHELKRFDEAITHYDKALSLKLDYAEAWSNKGATLHQLKRFDEAIAHYEKALSLKPNIDWAFGDLLHTKMKGCSWSGLVESLDDISKKVAANENVINPFALLALSDDAFLHKKCSEIYAQNMYPANFTLGPIPKASKRGKIRIAYFSPDFRNHPVSFLTAELFEIHDRSRFEVFAFSLKKAPIGDEMNIRLRNGFDRFIDVDNMTDLDIAQLARELEIDIAIDLTGPTQHSRTGIFSYRAAPIQVNWLGYPGTIGADFIDYIVADKIIIPEPHQQFYAEKIVYLPNTYMVDDSKRMASTRVFTKEECGLPENAFVFCCFNNDYKFNPQVLDSWSRILLAAKNSVIWISENNEYFRANIATEFENRGIDSDRVIFAPRVELMADHLARFTLADLFLDTYPYNAHTTTVDSLKAGVPVLTLKGQSFPGRVAASLLNAIGLPELITSTQEEYEALAIELAMNPQKLTDIKVNLARNRLTAPLFDTPLFTKHIEAAYIKMHERYQTDSQTDHMYIA